MLFEEVTQIDLTPTLALVLGLPIPYSNLGIVLNHMFEFYDKLTSIKANYIQVIFLNQNSLKNVFLIILFVSKIKITEFIKKYESLTSEKFIDKNEELNFDYLLNQNENDDKKLQIQLINYLKLIQNKCRDKWSTFNIKFCLIGLISIFFSTISFILFTNSLKQRKSTIKYLATELSAIALVFIIINLILCKLLQSNLIEHLWIYVFLFNFYFFSKFKFSLRRFCEFIHNTLRIDYFMLILIYLIPYSNSFIIGENNAIRFLLVSILFLDYYYKLKSTRNFDISCFTKFVCMLFLLRISSKFYVCREEAKDCQPTIFSTQLNKLEINSDHFYYFLFIFLNFSLITFINIVLILKMNLKSLFINFLYFVNISLLFVYKYMQFMESNDPNFKTFNLSLARFIYFLIFLSLVKICIDKSIIKFKKLCYFIISYSHLITLISSESFISIWFLISILFLYFNYQTNHNLLKNNIQYDSFIFLFLLKYYYFYATGHETTFTHIRWDSGFHGIYGDNNNPLIRLVMGFFILSNTFSSVIITSISIGLYFLNEKNKGRDELENFRVNKKILHNTIISKFITFGTIKVSKYLIKNNKNINQVFKY
jgi:hypothetical protein